MADREVLSGLADIGDQLTLILDALLALGLLTAGGKKDRDDGLALLAEVLKKARE
jgi:hypothetical protein